MFTIYVVSVILLHNTCANPMKRNVVRDSFSNDNMMKTLPSSQLKAFGDSLYYFEHIHGGNYHQAMQFCNYHNMQLVNIESEAENDFLWTHLRSSLGAGDYSFWTSGTELPDNHWVWMSTGRPIIYSNWFEGQPDNNGKNEHCLEVKYSNKNKALMWNDNVCTHLKHVICEKNISSTCNSIMTNADEE